MSRRCDHMRAASLRAFAVGTIPAQIPAAPGDWAAWVAPIDLAQVTSSCKRAKQRSTTPTFFKPLETPRGAGLSSSSPLNCIAQKGNKAAAARFLSGCWE